MILLIDNYDSFVYNLARYVSELGNDYLVKRNDAISLAEINDLHPSHIIISPGPCAPAQAGISLAVVQTFGSSIPILGVCLGHQVIAEAFGGKVVRARYPMHGKPSHIVHQGESLFKGLSNPFIAARYHSLIVSEENFPAELEMTAHCPQGEIMGLRHRFYSIYGVQFHPESILTQVGYEILQNFFNS